MFTFSFLTLESTSTLFDLLSSQSGSLTGTVGYRNCNSTSTLNSRTRGFSVPQTCPKERISSGNLFDVGVNFTPISLETGS